MITQAASIRQRFAGLQRGIMALASPGLAVTDRQRLRELWMQAGPGSRDPLLDNDPDHQQMLNRHLRWLTGEAEGLAAKYNLTLDTSDTTALTEQERDEAREGIAFWLPYRSNICPTCGK
ncbi:hypothetical protein [Mycobacteroides abscessus]|uniref:hypothetical protein n=1 Tax=Mycobacteroides abscessus TaxID=36809 RepID=UPI0009A87159|nr:hypothetical protein [Mycobacteroides abscessus]RIS77928.1 hypothetical protein D2E54_15360 [Mycobacteroides abscessus]SKQ73067.1 Uncharacterised protein [Mycobacteroides abscessus subsp. massiliense]